MLPFRSYSEGHTTMEWTSEENWFRSVTYEQLITAGIRVKLTLIVIASLGLIVHSCSKTRKNVEKGDQYGKHDAPVKSSIDAVPLPSPFLWDTQNISHYLIDRPDVTKIGPSFTYPTPLDSAAMSFLRYVRWHAARMECARNASCYEQNKGFFKDHDMEMPSRQTFNVRWNGRSYARYIELFCDCNDCTAGLFYLLAFRPIPLFTCGCSCGHWLACPLARSQRYE